MATPKPSLDLLRSMTDEHILRALMVTERATRAEIAVSTGLSKPTVSDAVRRLVERGVVVDTGERTSGRGRAGSYFSLDPDCGVALVCILTPTAVTADVVDARGSVVRRESVPLPLNPGPHRAGRALKAVAARVADNTPGGRIRAAVVSAAEPVDRQTGRLVHLADAPFIVGDLEPAKVLAPVTGGAPVLIDNDVHWAAWAELDAATEHADAHGTPALHDFVYLHLGAGLGCAVVADGRVRTGHRGMAGEIAHAVTAGPRGRAMRFTEVFSSLGLRRLGSTAIDEARLQRVLERGPRTHAYGTIIQAVAGVVSSATAFLEPQAVILGGSWGHDESLAQAVTDALADTVLPVEVRVSMVGQDAEVVGARLSAVEELRAAIVEDATATT